MIDIITIVMTTYFTEKNRKRLAEETLASWYNNLNFEGHIHLHIADDGSTLEWHPEDFWDGSITYSRQERDGVGASLNKGFQRGFELSPIVLYAVDDWKLTCPTNITHWVNVLKDREDVGMVRLGPPHPNTRGTVEAFSDHWNSWGLRLEKYGFYFGHRPALYHKRLIDAYGWFAENESALECERLYVENCTNQAGPDIILSLSSPWLHTSVNSLSDIDPKAS